MNIKVAAYGMTYLHYYIFETHIASFKAKTSYRVCYRIYHEICVNVKIQNIRTRLFRVSVFEVCFTNFTNNVACQLKRSQ